MDDLLAARTQMGFSLAFHIIFAVIGMAMPWLMATAHWLYLRRRDPAYLALTKAWSKGVAILFAIGAVSGTALSFELGLLWPEFMRAAGPIIGMPFSYEGLAFFLEAVALGLFLYGWERLPPWVHWGTGLCVGVTGVASAAFVVCANAWMNSPTGFVWQDGQFRDIDPVAAMFNARAFDQGLHMILAGFVATGFAVAGFHAWELLREARRARTARRRDQAQMTPQLRRIHECALKIALGFAGVAALLQPLSGDLTAKTLAKHQPLKLAAAESLFHGGPCAPMLLGGVPDMAAEVNHYGIEVPCLLSFLAFDDTHATVQGLLDFPRDQWPAVPLVHTAYQVMVGLGTMLAGIGGLSLFSVWRRRGWHLRIPALFGLTLLAPAGFICLECGWMVTELGRQPWIIYQIMRTKAALTPMPGIVYSLAVYAVLYLLLAWLAFWLLLRQRRILELGSAETHHA